MTVRIGVPLPTSADAAYNEANWRDYVAALRGAGAEAEQLSLSRELRELKHLLHTCDGFLLPGSPADVDPALYGQARESATAPPDALRDQCDRAVLEHVAETGKPVLAICYGMQHMNVCLGGSLVQDLLPVPVNHAAGASVAVAHSAHVVSQSLLAALLSAAEAPLEGTYRRLPINSSHHQAVSSPGEHLTVVARCHEDGVIEAVEGRIGLATVLGVQWHPERSVNISAASRALFVWLVTEAEDQRMRRSPEDDSAYLV